MPLITLTALLFLCLQVADKRKVDLPAKPVPVAILCNGDDGATARLCDQVKRTFSKSPDFTTEVAHQARFLIVRIPTNVQWKKDGRRAKLSYSVEISIKDGEVLHSTAGSCWENELNVCAANIMADTRTTIGFSP